MNQYLFVGESRKYKYFIGEDRQPSILNKRSGEVITDEKEIKKIFAELAAAFGLKVEKEEPPEAKHKYGVNGRVLLTVEEIQRLYKEFGIEEANACINYVDEQAEITGNKNKWKNWNLVIRKCHREQWHKSQRRTPLEQSTPSYDMTKFIAKAEKLPTYKKRADT